MTDLSSRLADLFSTYPELHKLKNLFQKNDVAVWLVGGTLRDLLLQRTVVDIDIASSADPTELARNWAQQVGGRWFWLDSDRRQSRVLLPEQVTVDFTPLRAETLTEDQALRDFRINSLALSLDADFNTAVLLDPLDGQRDIKQRVLQFCSARSISDDPLRMLKGIRHAVTLQMELSEHALWQIGEQADLIVTIAGERLRDELGQILSSEKPVQGLKMLHQTGLLECLFGPSSIGWDSEQTFISLETLDQRIQELDQGFAVERELNDHFPSRALFYLATLVKEYSPADLSNLLHNRMRMSRQQQRIILSLQQAPSSEWFALSEQVATARQQALLIEQLGYFPDEQIIYWALVKQFASLERVRDLLQAYYGQQQLGKVPHLLDGLQLRELLPGRPEKEIGAWQQRIKAAEVAGAVSSIDDVIGWLKSEISN